MIYGYARCSTNEDKQDIDRQTRELSAMGALNVLPVYISGSKESPELTALMGKLAEGDTLAVTEVSRLTRSLHQLCHTVETARDKRVRLRCGSLDIDFSKRADPAMLAMLYVMGVFAELEVAMTTDRIKSGLANAAAKGTKLGRPKLTEADIPQVVKDLLPRYNAGELSKIKYARLAGVSRPTLDKYLRLLLPKI